MKNEVKPLILLLMMIGGLILVPTAYYVDDMLSYNNKKGSITFRNDNFLIDNRTKATKSDVGMYMKSAYGNEKKGGAVRRKEAISDFGFVSESVVGERVQMKRKTKNRGVRVVQIGGESASYSRSRVEREGVGGSKLTVTRNEMIAQNNSFTEPTAMPTTRWNPGWVADETDDPGVPLGEGWVMLVFAVGFAVVKYCKRG